MIKSKHKKPLVSVIMPMQDHRGLAIPAVESWVKKQRCNPEDFEVLLIIDDTLREFEETFRRMLRPHDVLINQSADNEMEHYDIGATHSQGQYLFFTEPHCIAESDTVSKIIQYFTTHAEAGFCTRSTPICRNHIAHMELRMFDEGFQEWSRENDWRKVIMRGFCIRREIYRAVGGFNHAYDRFAEWLLAAILHAQGYRLGYAPDVVVQHCYTDNFSLFDEFIKEFTDGECLYRLKNPPEFCEQYFGSPPEWYEIRAFNRSLLVLILRVLWQQTRTLQGMASTFSGWRTSAQYVLHLLPSILFGRKKMLFTLKIAVWMAKLRCYLWWFHEDRMYRAFTDYWRHTTAYCRVKFVIEHPETPTGNAITTPCLSYVMKDLNNKGMFGFHALESYQGTLFRWSSAVAAMRVSLKPDDYRISIQLNNVRPIDPKQELSVFMNHTLLEPLTFNPEKLDMECSMSKNALNDSNVQWLIFCCAPLKTKDQRSLGLPVVSITFCPFSLQKDI